MSSIETLIVAKIVSICTTCEIVTCFPFSKRCPPHVDTPMDGGKSSRPAPARAYANLFDLPAHVVVVVACCFGMLPKGPTILESGFLVSPTVGTILVPRIVERVIVVGVAEFW